MQVAGSDLLTLSYPVFEVKQSSVKSDKTDNRSLLNDEQPLCTILSEESKSSTYGKDSSKMLTWSTVRLRV